MRLQARPALEGDEGEAQEFTLPLERRQPPEDTPVSSAKYGSPADGTGHGHLANTSFGVLGAMYRGIWDEKRSCDAGRASSPAERFFVQASKFGGGQGRLRWVVATLG